MDLLHILADTASQAERLQLPEAVGFPQDAIIVIDDDREPPTAKRTYSKQLTRDDRIRIRVLRFDANWTYESIASHTGYTYRQVQYACGNPVTPQRGNHVTRPGIKTPIRQQLAAWLREATAHRRIPWSEIYLVAPSPLNGFRESAYRTAMKLLGFERKVRPHHIHLTAIHKENRIAFAQEQLRLRPHPEDWETMIFSDETWATNDPMWKQ